MLPHALSTIEVRSRTRWCLAKLPLMRREGVERNVGEEVVRRPALPCDATTRCKKPSAWVVWRMGAPIQDYRFICFSHLKTLLKIESPDPNALEKIKRLPTLIQQGDR
jgi:hypothetical protein